MPDCEKCILLLPNPDFLQMNNVHRYITQSGYSAVFTMTTMALYQPGTRNAALGAFVPSGQQPTIGPGTRKIVIIGHGHIGGVEQTTVQDVINCLLCSGAPFRRAPGSPLKLTFDTCYAGAQPGNGTGSVLQQVKNAITNALGPPQMGENPVNISLSGGVGPTVTGFIGTPQAPEKRRYIANNQQVVGDLGTYQSILTKLHNVRISDPYQRIERTKIFFSKTVQFNERWESDMIKAHAAFAYDKIKAFMAAFKTATNQYNTNPHHGIDAIDKAQYKVTI